MAEKQDGVDDEDTKTRRNLLVASTIILLFAWLQLPVTAVADRLFGTSLKDPGFSVSEVRVWTAALVMLLYFGWRFWHSPQGQRLMRSDTSFAATVRGHLAQFRYQILVEIVCKYHQTGEDSTVVVPSLSDAVRAQWEEDRLSAAAMTDEVRARTLFERPPMRLSSAVGRFHKGRAEITYTWSPAGLDKGGDQRGRPLSVPFNIGAMRTLRRACVAVLQAIFETDAGVMLGVPVVLATTAMLVSIWRLGTAFLLPNIASWCVLPIQG